MGVRLNKILSELNIGLQTAVDFLKKRSELGEVKDDVTPNTKISDRQYEALVNEFSTDKAVKSQADQLFPKKAKEKKVEKPEKDVAKAEVLLEQRPQFKPLGKIDLDSIGKPKPAATVVPEPTIKPEPVVEKKEEVVAPLVQEEVQEPEKEPIEVVEEEKVEPEVVTEELESETEDGTASPV